MTANDPDADVPDTISWSLSGADARDFEITDQGNTDMAELSLKDSPNYERPADADMDNVYKVTVQAGDSVGNRGERDVEVTVTNAEEPGTMAPCLRFRRVWECRYRPLSAILTVE